MQTGIAQAADRRAAIGSLARSDCWFDIAGDTAVLIALQAVVGERVTYYNCRRRHSGIGYQAPISYLKHVQCESNGP